MVALKAMTIEDSNLGLSFVRISDFIFATSGIVVQPSEVQLQERFAEVTSLHISIYSIVSVEERGGPAGKPPSLKLKKNRSNLITFPTESPPR